MSGTTPYDIIGAIDYQLPLHDTTYSECCVNECKNSARGGRVCLPCVVEQSNNPEITASLVDAAKAKHAATLKLIEVSNG